jgi:hypothetical protein
MYSKLIVRHAFMLLLFQADISCHPSAGEQENYSIKTTLTSPESAKIISDSIQGRKLPAKTAAVDTIIGYSALDTALYDRLLLHLVHNKPSRKWPVQTDYPLPGAILPFKRIVAYYGNLYSPGMGVLGALPPEKMLLTLQSEVCAWQDADTLLPVQAALHYIAVTAQQKPGASGKYRLRMPFHQIDRILELAKKIDALVFLDIQVGHSTLPEEIPLLRSYLLLPQVHLGIDPEYSMKGGEVPCAAIGTFDAEDINYAAAYLADLVTAYHLPPKMLVVHRFTQGMVTGYNRIQTCPQVQIVMNMDGFGFPAKKINTYQQCIATQPVQFTGFKLFYTQDVHSSASGRLMQPEEILKLYPQPVYIQYQ